MPVRHWSVEKIESLIETRSKKVTSSPTVNTWNEKNRSYNNKFPGGANAEKSWNEWGYGRKASQQKWSE